MFTTDNQQQDPANSPTGDADLLSYLQSQSQGAPQVSTPASPAPEPQDPLELLRKKLALEAAKFPTGDSNSILRQKLGLEGPDGQAVKRGTLGKVGNAAGNILQILAGRNFSNEADKDYAAKLQGMGAAQKVLSQEDLNDYRTQAQQRLAEKDAQLVKIQAAHDATKAEVEKSKAATAAEANAIKRIRVLSQNTTDAGNAETKKALTDYQIAHPNQNPASILKEFATDPETGELDPVKYVQMSALIKQAGTSLGTQRTNTPFKDANGNFGSSILSTKILPDTSLTGLQRRLGIAPGAAAAATPGFSGPGAPVGNGTTQQPSSVIPAQPKPPGGVSLEFDPTKFNNPTALAAYGNNKLAYQGEQQRQKKEAADAGIMHTKLRYSAASTEGQTNNLARAIVRGDRSFQGPLQDIFQGVRDYFGGVSADEANQRIQDFRGLYDNLGSSVKGAYRTVEIKDGHLVQGHTGMDPESTLALHTVNTLAQQKRMLIVGKALAGTGVSVKELDDIAVDTANKYLKDVQDLRAKSENLPPALRDKQQAPTLVRLDQAVNEYIAKKKMGLVKTPAPTTKNATDFTKWAESK